MAKKKSSWDIVNDKSDQQDKKPNTIKRPPGRPKTKTGDEPAPKILRVHPQIHKYIRYNQKFLKMREYIEALVLIDRDGGTSWERYDKGEIERPE